MLNITLEEPLNVKTNSIIIGGDFHIPFQDDILIDQMLSFAQKSQIDILVCNGDFLDCKSFSDFFEMQQKELTFKEELEVAENVINKLSNVFKCMYFTTGNHEIWWLEKLSGQNNLSDLFKLFKGNLVLDSDIFVTNYDHLTLNYEWYICHPKNFSRIPTTIPRKLADRYDMNIICGHEHRLSLCKSFNSKYYCVESGGLFDSEKMEYLQSTTNYPAQVSGFVSLEKNVPTLHFKK